MAGVYSYNRLFDTFYVKGAQDLTGLDEDVYAEGATTATLFERYDDTLEDGWPEFIRDFCE